MTTERPDLESRQHFYTQILDGLRSLPGVDSAAAVLIRPLSGTVGWDTTCVAEGQSEREGHANPNGNFEAISPDYFHTMGIRLLAGRDFTAADNRDSARVVIVNESTAKRHWRTGGAVGKHIRLGSGPKPPIVTVAGVVSDVRYREWEAARSDFYVPYMQRAQHRTDFVLKSHADPATLIEAARRVVLSADPTQPVSNVTTMSTLVDKALARSGFQSLILGCLAVCAILLAAFGIYSVLAYTVGQSAFEIALRIAVGAVPRSIAKMIAIRGIRLVLVGAAIGLLASVVGSRLIASLLFGVSALDPLTYCLAVGSLLFVAIAAAARPALQAAALDPMKTLRSQG